MRFPTTTEAKAALRHALHPTSRLGKSILWFGGLAIAMQLWKLLAGP